MDWRKKLKIARKKAGLSQDGLGKKAELSQSTINQYENGGRDFTEKALRKIAKALEVDYSYFFNKKEKATSNTKVRHLGIVDQFDDTPWATELNQTALNLETIAPERKRLALDTLNRIAAGKPVHIPKEIYDELERQPEVKKKNSELIPIFDKNIPIITYKIDRNGKIHNASVIGDPDFDFIVDPKLTIGASITDFLSKTDVSRAMRAINECFLTGHDTFFYYTLQGDNIRSARIEKLNDDFIIAHHGVPTAAFPSQISNGTKDK